MNDFYTGCQISTIVWYKIYRTFIIFLARPTLLQAQLFQALLLVKDYFSVKFILLIINLLLVILRRFHDIRFKKRMFLDPFDFQYLFLGQSTFLCP